ncbi:MAG: peptidoglycan DD-metalloendopeptidase family protein [Pseudomonadota bacterium]
MAVRSISANWALTGGVIAVFGVLSLMGRNSDQVDPDPLTAEPTPIELPVPQETPSPSPETPETESDPAPVPEPNTEEEAPDPPVPSNAAFLPSLSICGSMTVSNRPSRLQDLEISNYQPTITINDVELAVAPVEAACFSSGFGPRGSSLHKGIDLHNSDPVAVYAAGDGILKEKLYRDDYGNMLVIDHGNGVFTRYAHLQSFADGLAVGASLSAGEPIGVMGNTASYSIPRHLHYELMTGEWGALSGSFGLTAINIMAQLPEN